MAIPEDLRALAQDIVSFRGERKEYVKDIKHTTADIRERHKKEIKDLADNVADMLATYDKEMKELAKDLRDFLSKSEQKRMADFKPMMAGIQTRIKDIFKETAELRGRFQREHKEMSADLKEFLSKSEKTRMAEFMPFMKDVVARVEDIKKETKDLMARLIKEHGMLSKDVKDLLTQFHGEDKERDRETKEKLGGYRDEMKRAKAAWAKVYGGLKVEESAEIKEAAPEAKPKTKRKKRKKKK